MCYDEGIVANNDQRANSKGIVRSSRKSEEQVRSREMSGGDIGSSLAKGP